MKFYITILSALLLSVFSLHAEDDKNSVNWAELKKNIENRLSPSYYPTLMNRYMAIDTTLTLEDFRNLYFGFALQEDYDPYRISPYSTKVKEFAMQNTAENVDCDSLIYYGEKAVADFPFDVRSINLLMYGYKCKKMDLKVKQWAYNLTGIIDAILSTGDGLTEDSPMEVIYAPHEYEIIHRFGLQVKNNIMMPPNLEFIEVEGNKFSVEGYFFDISKILEVYDDKFAE